MKKSILGGLLAIAAIGLFAFNGCAGYGSTNHIDYEQHRLAGIIDDFDDYHVFYSGMSQGLPSGIVFAPEADDKTIARKQWITVEDKEQAEKLVNNLEGYRNYPARLYELTGEDGRPYGYIYTVEKRVVVQQLAPDTIYVQAINSPPHLKEP